MKKLYTVIFAASLLSIPAFADVDMKIYYSDNCPHCHHARGFVKDTLVYEYPMLQVKEINVLHNVDDFRAAVNECGLKSGGVPLVVIGEECFQGYGDESNSGNLYRSAVDEYLTESEKALVSDIKSMLKEDAGKYRADNATRAAAQITNAGAAVAQEDAQLKKNDTRTPAYFYGLLIILVLGLGLVLFTKRKK